MKKITLKIVVLILLINSNFILAQEWKNLKSYQKATENKTLLEGYWLKKDRKKRTKVWKQANKYNLSLKNGNRKYKTIREIRDFYRWFDSERIRQGHEITWIGIATIATEQLSKLEMGFNRLFIVRNKEITQFVLEGSIKVFSFAFFKLKEVYFLNKILKGKEAENWDKTYGINEQCILLEPLYIKLSKKGFSKLERMAKGKGLFRLVVSKKLKFEGDLKNCEARINYGIKKLLPLYLKKQKKSNVNN